MPGRLLAAAWRAREKTAHRARCLSSRMRRARAISAARLSASPRLHLRPIDQVVYLGPYGEWTHLGDGFPLRCLQRLSVPDVARRPCRWSTTAAPEVRPPRSSRTQGQTSSIHLRLREDRDRTVSRRSEPSSDSWARSACYPRRTFYPMSDGPSIRDHRITNANFRSCSRCLSYSQAPLCVCTQRLVSDQAEGTFACLRYTLGGDRPSQTTRQTLSFSGITGRS